MIPEGWKESTVGKACRIKNNLRLPISETEREKMEGPFPYIGPTGILDYINEFRIDEEFVTIGEDGDHFLKYKEKEMTFYYNEKSNVNNHAHIICNSENCLAKWFGLFFQHRDITSFITRQGAKRYKLTKDALERLPILLPPLAEQKKIAEILSTWDEAISVVDKQLENCRQQKKALMQQLLTGKKRLPGFSGEWKKTKLSSFCKRITERNNGHCSLVATISAQYGLIRQEEFFNKSVASETLDNYFLLRKGDFAYNKSYSLGYPMGAIKRLNRYQEAVVTSLYICFRLDETKADSDYFEFFFDSGLLDKSLTQIAAEGGRAHGLLNVRPDDFMGIQILFPPLEEQKAIASVLSTSARQIEMLEQKLNALQEEKKSLMQQLLTGKKRVAV